MAKKTDSENPAAKIEVYFDSRDGGYWFKRNGRFTNFKKADLKLHFYTLGLSDEKYITTNLGVLRETDFPFWEAAEKRMIDYAGPLAGHRTGLFNDGSGGKFLITNEPQAAIWSDVPKRIAKPKFFSAFIEELLPDDQHLHFCYWLSSALQSLRLGDFAPGQVCFFIGEAKCGKSLLQDIITEVLGGRDGNPLDYLTGATQFNSELISSEHWKMEDPKSSTDIRSRREFGEMLKLAAFTRTFKIHKKGKDGVTFPLFRRITVSVNSETENVARCPPMDQSLHDKINLYRCAKVKKVFEPYRLDGPALPGMEKETISAKVHRNKLWQVIKDEAPQIRAWLLSQFKNPPADLVDDRTGVVSFHHQEIMSELSSLAPEHRLLQLVDLAYFSGDGPHSPISDIKSFALENELADKAANQTHAIARHLNWAGSYLGKLYKSGNPRISKRVLDGTTLWTIKPPSLTTENTGEK